MADVQVKRKITVTASARLDYKRETPSRPASPTKIIRPASPTKSTPKIQSTPATPIARPRAKISSSAAVGGARKPAGGLAPGYGSGTSTPRATSPTKQLELKHGRSSPQLLSVSRMRSRTNVASVPNSPRMGSAASSSSQLSQTSMSAAASDSALVKTPPPRVRHASISSMSQVSGVSSVRSNLFSPPSSVISSQESDLQSTVSSTRIKAKVSGVAKAKAPATPPSSSSSSTWLPSSAASPPLNSTLSTQRMGRTPSVSSLSNKEPLFNPITTASPAANVHRFATVRSPPSSRRSSSAFIAPQQSDQPTVHVDPALIPLPPLSPPSSTLSFSSHSSASRSSLSMASHSTAPTFNAEVNGQSLDHNILLSNNGLSKPRSNSFIIRDLGGVREENGLYKVSNEDDEEKKIRAEAKSNRKIADLEITNKSLMAINAQLEATKHKQAKEIRELRRKLRESRLILPPRTYRELRLSSGPEEVGFHDDDVDDEEEEEEGEEVDTSVEITKISKEDEIYMRVRGLIDTLLESGKRALETKVEDFAPAKGGTKVLHEIEARTWRYGLGEGQADTAADESFDDSFITADSGDEAAANFPGSRRVSRIRNEDSLRSEEEVEDIVGDPDQPHSSSQ